jgi:hypothetical protein
MIWTRPCSVAQDVGRDDKVAVSRIEVTAGVCVKVSRDGWY